MGGLRGFVNGVFVASAYRERRQQVGGRRTANSRRAAVVPQHPAEPFFADDFAVGTADFLARVDDAVFEPLMVSLFVAMQKGTAVRNQLETNNISADKYLWVGHSMGGGLASAASRKSGIDAVTFNAAGLHPSTVGESWLSTEITAYKVDYDLLSRIQDGSIANLLGPNIPQALGTHVDLTSQYKTEYSGLVGQLHNLVDLLLGLPLNFWSRLIGRSQDERDLVHVGATCHGIDQVIYGLLDLADNPDAFGKGKELGIFLPWEEPE